MTWDRIRDLSTSVRIEQQLISPSVIFLRQKSAARGCSLQMKVSHNFALLNISSTFPQHFNIPPISTSYQHMPHFVNSTKLGSRVRLKVSWSSVDFVVGYLPLTCWVVAKIIECLNTGCPVSPKYHFHSRWHTCSYQNVMKLAGQLKWVLLRVCKQFLVNMPMTLVKYLTLYDCLLLQWESSVCPQELCVPTFSNFREKFLPG